MSLSIGLIAVVALVYMAILFAIAFYGDRRRTPLSPRLRAWVYSLSLAVYCTSWTFFGAVGQATDQLWSFLPIYLGPVLLMLFAPWVLQKMIMISKQENITSIVDLLIGSLNKRLADKQLTVELTPAAKTYVIDNGYDPLYGARPLRRFLQHTVETLVGRKMIADEVLPGTTLVVDCENDQLVVR